MYDVRAPAAGPGRRLPWLAAMALAGTLGASAAMAEPSAGGPRSLSRGDIETWIASRIDPAGWRYLSFDGDGAYFLSAEPAWRTAQGNWRFVVREELFQPEQGAQSLVMQTEVDCDGRKLRLPGVKAYSAHNLKGLPEDRGPIAEWVSAETPGESAQMTQLCALAKATPADLQPLETPAPDSVAAKDVQGWVDRYLDLHGWRLVEAVSDGVNLVASSGAKRTAKGALRIWSRTEFYRPVAYPAGGPPARSARQLMELDCKAGRAHIVQIVAYAQNNLKGAATPPLALAKAPWETPAAGTHEAKVVQGLCQLAAAEAPAPPPPPHVKKVRRRSVRRTETAQPRTVS